MQLGTHSPATRRRRRHGRFGLVAGLASILIVGSGAATSQAADRGLTVMTRNLYFGTDLGPVIASPTQPAFFANVAAALTQARASDFAGRASAWADEIEREQPDLVGLQEAVMWRTQAPTDLSQIPNAATPEADFLDLLLDELDARGLRYEKAASAEGWDVEAPGLFAGRLIDVRLTQVEAILVRKTSGLKVTNPQGGKYDARISISTAVGPISLPWAWASVDVSFHGQEFRFATTHLDSNSGAAQLAQASEFLAGPGDTELPIIWVGDFNSDAEGTTITGTPPATATYGTIIAAGFEDAWNEKHPADPGFTCCHATDLRNVTPTLTRRIDLVLTRGPFDIEEASLVGEAPADRLPSGVWPSDHAGVVATLQLEDDD